MGAGGSGGGAVESQAGGGAEQAEEGGEDEEPDPHCNTWLLPLSVKACLSAQQDWCGTLGREKLSYPPLSLSPIILPATPLSCPMLVPGSLLFRLPC